MPNWWQTVALDLHFNARGYGVDHLLTHGRNKAHIPEELQGEETVIKLNNQTAP